MTYATVITYTLREITRQPAFLLAIIVEVATIVFLVVGVRLEYEQDTLLGMTIVGREIGSDQIDYFILQILPAFTGLLHSALIFLFIVGTSHVYPELLQDPLLGITLAKPISRGGFFLSKFAGTSLAVFVNVLSYSFIIALILVGKGAAAALLALSPSISLTILYEFVLIAALCSFFALLVESTTAVAILGLTVYFILGPLVADVQESWGMVLKLISYLVPPTEALRVSGQATILGNKSLPLPSLHAVIYSIASLAAALYVFLKRDIA